jgi:hypothetical protein
MKKKQTSEKNLKLTVIVLTSEERSLMLDIIERFIVNGYYPQDSTNDLWAECARNARDQIEYAEEIDAKVLSRTTDLARAHWLADTGLDKVTLNEKWDNVMKTKRLYCRYLGSGLFVWTCKKHPLTH